MNNIFSPDQWLFPCPGCGKYGNGGTRNSFCRSCLEKIEFFPENAHRCPGCGGILDNPLALCTQCLAEKPRLWQNALAVMPYRGHGRELIRRYKFLNFPALSRPLGTLAAEVFMKSAFDVDILIPIPLHFSRMIKRSYNQAALISARMSRICSIPTVKVLKRKHPGTTQASLDRRGRHRNLEHVFYITDPEKIRNRHVMLVDDILTTGATLNAAAAVIAKADPASITVLVIARSVGYR